MTQAYCEIVTSVANMQERKEGRSRVQSILAALEERINPQFWSEKKVRKLQKPCLGQCRGGC